MTDSNPTPNPVEENYGIYIAVEGPDGAGKTTAIKLVQELFQEHDKELLEVNILKGHPNSLALRTILTDVSTSMHPRTEMAYYIAAVLNTLTQVVEPLRRHHKKNIISDRGPDSSMVYQCMTLGNNDTAMLGMHQAAFAGLEPGLTIYIEPKEVQEGLDRAEARDGALDRIELRGAEYQQGVLNNYRMVAQAHAFAGRKVAIVTNDGTVEELKEKLKKALYHTATLIKKN